MKKEFYKSVKKIMNVSIINEFLMQLKVDKKSTNTIDKYRRGLENFFVLCPIPLKDLKSDDVYNALTIMTIGRQKATKLYYFHVLSSFFHYCMREGHINDELLKSRWKPKLSKPLPKYLTKKEQELLRIAAEKLTLVHRLIYEFCLSTGCRCNELRMVNINDINLENHTATVLGKGNKQRVVYFNNTTALLLQKYMTEHTDEKLPLLLNCSGDRINNEAIRLKLKEIVKLAGLRPDISTHWLRHSFATNLQSKGLDIHEVSPLLGHADGQATQIYTHLIPEQTRSLYNQYKA